MDRYELVEGKSSKFWEIGIDGATVSVRFGRLGTDGQTKDKDFADAAAAAKERDRLVREKTGKGYALVAARSAPAPKATETKGEAAAAPEAPPPPTPAPDPSEAPAVAPVEEGHGRLFEGVSLPTRTRPGPHIGAEEAWALFRERLGAVLPDDGHADWVPPMRRAIAGGVPRLDTDTAVAWMQATQAAFDLVSPKHWKDTTRWKNDTRACMEALARALVEVGDARVVAEIAARLPLERGSPHAHYSDLSWAEPLHLAMRAALVHAPEKDYEDAIGFLLKQPTPAGDFRLPAAFAFILADDRPAPHQLQPLAVLETASAAGADILADRTFVPLIADAPPTAAARWRTKRSHHLYLVYCAVDARQAAATLRDVAGAAGESPLPSLDWLLYYVSDEHRTVVAEAILETREPGSVAALLPVLHEKWIRPALDAAAEVYPASTFAECLAALASGRSEPALRARVADMIDRFGAEQARAWAAPVGTKAQAYLARLLDARDVPPADPSAWPRVLREPPWRQKLRATGDIVLDLAPIATPLVHAFGEIEPSYWRRQGAIALDTMSELATFIRETEPIPGRSGLRPPPEASTLPAEGDDVAAVLAWLVERMAQLEATASYIFLVSRYGKLIDAMERQPEPLAMTLWSQTAILVRRIYISDWPEIVSGMLRGFGERALPGLVKLVEAHPISLLLAVLPVDDGGIAPPAARALCKLKKARVPALTWLRRHRETAMTRLVPDAVGKLGAARDAAEHAIRTLVADRDDGRAALDAVVARYAATEPRVADAIAQVLARDPLARVPTKVGKPPAWVVPSALARPRLQGDRHGGGALPDAAVLALVEMLSFVNPDDVYAGVAQVIEACTADSLAAFAWDLFSAWIAAGGPSKDGWALRAVGWLGDDTCARELTRLIRRWPGEAAHARAVTGLDVLADIGSDVALMNLNGIAEKLKFKGLQEKARAKIAVLAEARGLSAEELSDRLAPDLDLDERGGLDLDFGPRGFRAGFDELLKPWVKDASGQRLKDMPKPIKSDDAEKGAAAVARWAALKKDARAVATLQLNRLEAMLATSRRVKPEVFQLFFAAHPLVRHLTQRLVSATFADADPRTRPGVVFRVAEDLSFTDAEDAAIEIDVSNEAPGLIGLLHPLHLDRDALAPWGALFGDYEIAQPFPQLARETFAFTPAEAAAGETSRFDGVAVETARVRGMAARGWPLGTLEDHGVASWIEREIAFPDGTNATVSLMFEDGIFAGARDAEDATQTLGKLSFDNHWTASQARGAHTFGALDPVTASELLRGPSLLAETRVR